MTQKIALHTKAAYDEGRALYLMIGPRHNDKPANQYFLDRLDRTRAKEGTYPGITKAFIDGYVSAA